MSRAHCVRSAHVVGDVARTADRPHACRAHSQRMSRACWACTGRDTPRQPAPCRDLTSMLRHQGNQNHVVTSNRCRDTTQASPSCDLLELHLCRDIASMSRPPSQPPMSRHQSMSRLQFPTGQVTTSITCRDLLKTNLCRDINFMSRPPFCHSEISRSRRQHPGCDLPHCYPCRDLKVMSRHLVQPAATQLGRDVPFLVATSRPTTPGRDFLTMSRPQTGPNLQLFFFFFQNHPVALFFFFLLLLKMQ